MQRTKPLTISAQLVPGRGSDDRLIAGLYKDSINLSSVIREALHMYLDKQDGRPDFEKEVLSELKSIKFSLQAGGAMPTEKPKSNNPFLSSSP